MRVVVNVTDPEHGRITFPRELQPYNLSGGGGVRLIGLLAVFTSELSLACHGQHVRVYA